MLPSPTPASIRPSGIRWHILALVMALVCVSQFNRYTMAVAGNNRIMRDYRLSPTEMGNIYSAFVLVYSLCMIPGGLLIDRIGPRRALMLVGLGSALFGALTGVAGWVCASGAAIWLFLVWVRGTMGAVSAPLHPAGARAVGNWFPSHQRTLGNGLVTGAALVGIASSYVGFSMVMRWIGWPWAFVWSAIVTAGLTLLWALYATDLPVTHRQVNAAERQLVEGLPTIGSEPARAAAPWLSLLRNRSLVFLTLSYAAVGYLQYLVFYWIDYYFSHEMRLGPDLSKLYASIPTIGMAFTMPMGGWLADRLARRSGVRRGRAVVSGFGMVLCAGLFGLGLLADQANWKVTWFTLAFGALGLSEAPFWATAVDLGGRAGGTAAAIINTGGNVVGAIAPTLTPYVAQHWGWPAGLSLGGIICFLGGLCWWKIDPHPAAEDSRPAISQP